MMQSSVEIADVAGTDTLARRVLDRMLELATKDCPNFTGEDSSEVLWSILTQQRKITSLQLAVIAQNLGVAPLSLLKGGGTETVKIAGGAAIDEWCPPEED